MNQDTAKRTRRTRTKDWRPKFLEGLAYSGIVKMAAEAVKVGRTTVYAERERNSVFAASMDDALEEALDTLEGEVFRRGVMGWEETTYELPKTPRFDEAGDLILIPIPTKIVQKYDSTLLLAQLNAHGKKRGYTRDSRVQLSGQIDQKHTVRVTTDRKRTYGGKAGPSTNGAVPTNGATEART